MLRNFRKDGHNWKKKKDGKTVKEVHEHLKVGNEERIHVYYAHGQENMSFVRRCYWLLDKSLEHIVLVHYRITQEVVCISFFFPFYKFNFPSWRLLYNAYRVMSTIISMWYLQVSKDGDILYVFFKHYRSKLAAKSFRIRAEEAKAAGGYLIKLSFGTTLMAPLFLLYATTYNMHISDNDNHGIKTFLKPVERFLPKEVLLYIMAPFLFYTMASALLSGIRNKGNHTLGKLYDKVKSSFSKLNLIQVLPTLYLFIFWKLLKIKLVKDTI